MTVKTWDEVMADIEERDRRHEVRPWPVRKAVEAFWRVRRTARDVRRARPLRRARWAVQRARRGYSDRDVWGFDTYLAGVISGGVRQLAHGHSYPMDMTPEEWVDILTRIADPLDQWVAGDEHADGETTEQYVQRREAEYKAAQDALRLMADRLGNLWD